MYPEVATMLERVSDRAMGQAACYDQRLPEDTSVFELLRPLRSLLGESDVTEICLNEPGVIFAERNGLWTRYELAELTLERCLSLAVAIGTFANQEISEQQPIMSATLPGGERAQIVIPPACPTGRVAISIRKHAMSLHSLQTLAQDGFFEAQCLKEACETRYGESDPGAIRQPSDLEIIDSLRAQRFGTFFELCVRHKRNIAIIGDTGSGKTTFMKALCQMIPREERLITIEDVRELHFPNHPNCVNLLYSRAEAMELRVSPTQLIASSMRMRPDRVLLGELRGAEAFDFLKLLTTGHAGSITSYHAKSCGLAHERFILMAKEHPEASIFDESILRRLVELTLDAIVHVGRADGHRRVLDIQYTSRV